jgi:hypothetical protein
MSNIAIKHYFKSNIEENSLLKHEIAINFISSLSGKKNT